MNQIQQSCSLDTVVAVVIGGDNNHVSQIRKALKEFNIPIRHCYVDGCADPANLAYPPSNEVDTPLILTHRVASKAVIVSPLTREVFLKHGELFENFSC